MQLLFQSMKNHRRQSQGGLGLPIHLRIPGYRLTNIWIRCRMFDREVFLETTQQLDRPSEFLVQLLRCLIPSLSRRLYCIVGGD